MTNTVSLYHNSFRATMFPKNSKEIVLIGEPYQSKESFSLLDSKIGGWPVLLFE